MSSCLVMPGGIGAVVYFLLRQPVLCDARTARTELDATVHFCPQCAVPGGPGVRPVLSRVKITDLYCAQCGHAVADGPRPGAASRL